MDTKALKKSLQKKQIPTTLSRITEWVSSGNKALNYVMTGDFERGIPNKRTVVFSGPSGSGKSFLLGNIAKNVQDKGYHIIYIDTENAITEDFLTKIGVQMDEEHFTPIRVHSIEECQEVLSEVLSMVGDDGDKVGVFIDSLSMLEPQKTVDEFDKSGEMKADQGRKAKMLKAMVNMLNAKVSDKDMFCVMTGHVYKSQDIYSGTQYHFSGGEAIMYIPSISVLLTKGKLKDGKEVSGIKLKAEAWKTRFFKLGTKAEIEVPYDDGMDPHSGLLEFLETEGYVRKSGAWYYYTYEGEEYKFQKNKLADHYHYLSAASQSYEPVEQEEEEDLGDTEGV